MQSTGHLLANQVIRSIEGYCCEHVDYSESSWSTSLRSVRYLGNVKEQILKVLKGYNCQVDSFDGSEYNCTVYKVEIDSVIMEILLTSYFSINEPGRVTNVVVDVCVS